MFPNGKSLFSSASNKDNSLKNLDNDLNKIRYWVYQWKMTINLDLKEQPQELIFMC